MFEKAKLVTAEIIAKLFNLAIEVLDNLRDFILAMMGLLDIRAVTF